MTPSEAAEIFRRARLDPEEDFHCLSSSDVERLLAEADRLNYRKPANAPGSRGRMFHQWLRRVVRRGE